VGAFIGMAASGLITFVLMSFGRAMTWQRLENQKNAG